MTKNFSFLTREQGPILLNLEKQIDDFLHAKRRAKRSGKTIKTYAQTLNAFMKWYNQSGLTEMTSDDFKSYIDYLTFEKRKWDDHPTNETKDSAPSARSVNNIIRNLRVFFNYLVKERIISYSPADNVEYQTEPEDTFDIFTDDEVTRLVEAPNLRIFTGLRDYTMMLVLTDTGLRVSELTGLHIRDVDLRLLQVTVPAEIAKNNRTRVIPISYKTGKALERLIDFMNISPDDYLWLTQFGERYFGDTFAKMLKKYGKKAGITQARCSPHTFRHYFAIKFLIGDGETHRGDPFALMRILGHTDMSMTQRYVRYAQMHITQYHEKASPVTNLLDKGNARKRGTVKFK